MISMAVSGGQLEDRFDEPDLPPDIGATRPPNLSLPNHVHRLVSLDDAACRVKFAEALLGVHSSFNRSVVLFQDVV
jgi:hypothetical protein